MSDQSHRRATMLKSVRLLLFVRSLIALCGVLKGKLEGERELTYLVSGIAGQVTNP